ncbi:MAG: AsmA family protein [Pseudomonadota bacterium]
MAAALSAAGPRSIRRWPLALAAVLLAVGGVFAAAEVMGWPWLAAPLQQTLSETLGRRVRIADGPGFQLRLVGGLRVKSSHVEIDAPPWSAEPHLLRADELALELRYIDLWRARRGQGLRVESLSAAHLDAHLERLADGRVSWPAGPAPGAARAALPAFGRLQLGQGSLTYHDVPLAIDVKARVSWTGADSPEAQTHGRPLSGVLRVDANGQVRRLPLKLELIASGVVPAGLAPIGPVPLSMKASIGRAQLVFAGTAADVLHMDGLAGRYELKGPSLAAVGDLVGVTLPTTAAFQTQGTVQRDAESWRVVVDAATVGASRLDGAFVYDRGGRVPLLSGRLGGARLLLADLGPVVGTTPAATAAPLAAGAASAPVSLPASTRGSGKVLPNRTFDLPALRAMDANVLIDIDSVDLNTSLLEPLRPLRTHLLLGGGVLTLRNLDARTAQGRLSGELALDGRESTALWRADLRWSDVRLERWIRQERANAAPPFVSGRLNGRATLTGQGRSTAEILGSLKGQVRTDLRGGSVSHLAVEAAGIDVAQSLGVLLRGDDALPVTCAVADLVAERGALRASTLVIDTSDSTVWITGALSLADETLDLRAVVSPKDFSPLALRTPLRVRGSFARPQVSLEKSALGRKVASALLLGLINPLAALVPLLDPGDADSAARGASGCRALMERSGAARARG